MDDSSHRHVMDLLYEAARLTAAEREAFLQNACKGDDELKREVESLLKYSACDSDAFGDTILDQRRRRVAEAAGLGEDHPGVGSSNLVGLDAPTVALPHPTRFGDYQIIRLIGEGGMACVYEAAQSYPRRTVALKAIKPGIASKRLVDRLRREVNVLGRLQHAGIAQLYDAGVAEVASGAQPQPFFVMELVDGERLDDFARRRNLDDHERLRLVAGVCDAVQHAHERGVLHRDLKFNNILVTPSGLPKVLDFGVSRIMSAPDHTLTVETVAGELLGTVPYMSPEQVEGDPEKLDARSDVYSLGVLCFELLSGRLPYEIRKASLPEATRVIRFEDPLRLGDVARRFRGDVETLVARTLEKLPERRYASAGEFGADIARFLAGDPIMARPPSTMYQLGKFARRNRGLVTGIVGMFVTLIAGLATTGWFAWEASVQRDEAGRERDIAQREARRVAALNKFLIDDLFGAADPRSGEAFDRSVMDMLADASVNVEDAFEEDPDIEILVRTALGEILRKLGDYDASELHLRRAFEMAVNLYGENDEETLEPPGLLARTLSVMDRFDDARRLLEVQLTIQEGMANPDPEVLAMAVGRLGDVAYRAGQYDEAEPLYRRVIRILEAAGLEQSELYGGALNDIANAIHNDGRLEESIALHRQVLALRTEELGTEHPLTAQSMHNLGAILLMHGEVGEAEEILTEALAIRERLVGGVHPDIADTLQQLGRIRLKEGDGKAARAFAERALAMQRQLLPANHTSIAFALDLMANAAKLSDDWETHEKCHREAHAIYVATEGPESRAAAASLGNIGVSLLLQERFDEAAEIHRQALTVLRTAYGDDRPHQYLCQTSLGVCLTHAGRYEEAVGPLREGHANLVRLDHSQASWAYESLEALFKAWGRPDLLSELQAQRDVSQAGKP